MNDFTEQQVRQLLDHATEFDFGDFRVKKNRDGIWCIDKFGTAGEEEEFQHKEWALSVALEVARAISATSLKPSYLVPHVKICQAVERISARAKDTQ